VELRDKTTAGATLYPLESQPYELASYDTKNLNKLLMENKILQIFLDSLPGN
jgi:hypothetical protein